MSNVVFQAPENGVEERDGLDLMPARLKTIFEEMGTDAENCLLRLSNTAYNIRRRLLGIDGNRMPHLHYQFQLRFQELRESLLGALFALGEVYLRFRYFGTQPQPGSFLGDLDSTDRFFVINRAAIEDRPDLVQNLAVQRQVAADAEPPHRHRPQVVALKVQLVAFLREQIGVFEEHLLTHPSFRGAVETIFADASRIMRCLPEIATEISRTIEEEAAAAAAAFIGQSCFASFVASPQWTGDCRENSSGQSFQNIYQDIRDQNLEEDKDEDENIAEAHARAQMAPMLTTTNRFLGSVQQMMSSKCGSNIFQQQQQQRLQTLTAKPASQPEHSLNTESTLPNRTTTKPHSLQSEPLPDQEVCLTLRARTKLACLQARLTLQTLKTLPAMQWLVPSKTWQWPWSLQRPPLTTDQQDPKRILHWIEPMIDGSLADYVSNHWPEPFVACLMLQLLLAFSYLHSKGIVHNDVKPDNILVRNGTVKIADYEKAIYLEEELQEEGRPIRMAPFATPPPKWLGPD
ncbi:serine/threonine protein kinase, CMGC, CDC2/CDK sub [Tyrophagus putrescentiae]|nr:serine/threonine protein kinase, CMGC, CDC2/CDK sub [Tyrophagus putrescentiae]